MNPSLWRQGQLNAINGLSEVAEGIYQVPRPGPVDFGEPPMAHPATCVYGALTSKGSTGQVGVRLGLTTCTGTVTLIPPTVAVTPHRHPDGVQANAGNRGAAELNFHLPDRQALCIAEKRDARSP